jgi:hypothetical protein
MGLISSTSSGAGPGYVERILKGEKLAARRRSLR